MSASIARVTFVCRAVKRTAVLISQKRARKRPRPVVTFESRLSMISAASVFPVISPSGIHVLAGAAAKTVPLFLPLSTPFSCLNDGGESLRRVAQGDAVFATLTSSFATFCSRAPRGAWSIFDRRIYTKRKRGGMRFWTVPLRLFRTGNRVCHFHNWTNSEGQACFWENCPLRDISVSKFHSIAVELWLPELIVFRMDNRIFFGQLNDSHYNYIRRYKNYVLYIYIYFFYRKYQKMTEHVRVTFGHVDITVNFSYGNIVIQIKLTNECFDNFVILYFSYFIRNKICIQFPFFYSYVLRNSTSSK